MWDATKSIFAGLGVRAVDNSNVVPLRYLDQHPQRATEGGLGIDHPVVAVQAAHQFRELCRVGETRNWARRGCCEKRAPQGLGERLFNWT